MKAAGAPSADLGARDSEADPDPSAQPERSSCVWVGIDPGQHGAIAAVYPGRDPRVWDMPLLDGRDSKGRMRRELDLWALLGILRGLPRDSRVVLEEIHASPLQRPGAPIAPGAIATSNFRLGEARGALRMALVAAELRFERVAVATWRARIFEGRARGKGASLERARELFPRAPLSAKSHDGRAEALLLAEYGRRHVS